jgi:hypothetical protein
MKPIGYLDDRSEMVGRMIHGLEVLGPFSEADRLARRYGIEEIIVMSTFLSRFPQYEELKKSGVAIRAISDPSDIAVVQGRIPTEAPCTGKRVLVAGNGEFVKTARQLFPEVKELVLVSNEHRILDSSRQYGDIDRHRDASYLGILEDRSAIRIVLERHEPDFVFVDFTLKCKAISNPLEGFLRTVLLPLERLASEVEQLSTTRLLAIRHGFSFEGENLEKVENIFELVLCDIFRHAQDRLTIIGSEALSGWGTEIISDMVKREGGIYRFSYLSEEGRPAIEKISLPPPPTEVGMLFLELTRSLDDGNMERAAYIIREIDNTTAVREYD